MNQIPNKSRIIWAQYFLALLLIIQPFTFTLAQKMDMNDYRQKYPGEARIFLDTRTDINIDIISDKLQIDMKNHEETLCIDKNVMYKDNQGVSTSGFFNVTAISAKTLVPTKHGYKTINVEKFDTSDFSRSSSFFDDVRSINFAFPKVEEGSRTVLDYTYHISEPRYLNSYYFSNYIPVESSELTVICPPNVNIGYKLMNCDSLKLEFTRKQVGNKIVYQWKAHKIPKLNIIFSATNLILHCKNVTAYLRVKYVNTIYGSS